MCRCVLKPSPYIYERHGTDLVPIKHATIQDSWDCEGTQSCCDYILFRMCCTDGTAVQEQWVPVPIPVRPNDGYPGPYSGRAAHR